MIGFRPIRGMRRVPRKLGPRPAPHPAFEAEYAAMIPFIRSDMEHIDAQPEAWQRLLREFTVEEVEDARAACGGDVRLARAKLEADAAYVRSEGLNLVDLYVDRTWPADRA